MSISKTTIQRIKEAANIVDVVGDFVQLKKSGVRYLGLCPFHDDRHIGSFVVYPKGNVFKCFVCDAKGGPVDFLMRHLGLSFPNAIRWLGKRYSIETNMNNFTYTPPTSHRQPEPLPMLTFPWSLVSSREQDREQNTLVRWLREGVAWDDVQRKRVDEVLNDYHVGTNKHNGMTIFWQIDELQRVRTGKMMLYKTDGHRDREARYGFDWVHSALFRDNRWPQYDDLLVEARPTLFGLHLLNHFGRNATVNIVESEKTALVMAIAYGNHPLQVWMACGGLEMLNRERIKPIIEQHRRIVLYPDRDGIDRWRDKAAALHYERVYINAEPVMRWWREEDGPKADVADVVVRIINNAKPPITPTDGEEPHGKKLDLKEVDNDTENH